MTETFFCAPESMREMNTWLSCRIAGIPANRDREHWLQNRQSAASSRQLLQLVCDEGGLLSMEIRFISSLTAEDENLFAPALLKAVGVLLDQLPIAYTLRIETTGAQVLQHNHAGAPEPRSQTASASTGFVTRRSASPFSPSSRA